MGGDKAGKLELELEHLGCNCNCNCNRRSSCNVEAQEAFRASIMHSSCQRGLTGNGVRDRVSARVELEV
jgi:hypothetical protein